MNLSPLPRATPESQGISSRAISSFLAAADATISELHSFMLLRRGKVLAEGWWHPYTPQRPHMLFSLSKSFTSTAVGMAINDNRLSIDDPIISFFPVETPKKVSPNLAAMKVRHLLSMVTGHSAEAVGRMNAGKGSNWVRNFLATPVENVPGAPFVYNNGASYMLSAIIQTLTGQTLLEYLRPRLFEPLGIHSPTWETCPRGINCGGWGLNLTTEDIARFGQLYLQKGLWNGQRLLAEEWVTAATSKQVSNGTDPQSDWTQGYGYQFWRCRHNAYRGDGAFGQFCIVLPEQQAVIAITSGVDAMQPVLNLVWQHLLPALQKSPLPEDATAHQALAQHSSQLNLLPPSAQPTSELAKSVSKIVYQVEPNPVRVSTLAFDFTPHGCQVSILQGKRHRHSFTCGYGRWAEGSTTLTSRQPRAIITSGTWTAPDTFTITLRYVETPFTQTLTCVFTGSTVTIRQVMNLAFGPNEGPTLQGKAA